MTRELAETVAIQALSYIAEEPDRLGRFLALSGIGPESLRDAATQAAESFRLTTLRYKLGEATILEFVDALNTLVTVRNAYDDVQARYRVALANLQTLTGNF